MLVCIFRFSDGFAPVAMRRIDWRHGCDDAVFCEVAKTNLKNAELVEVTGMANL